MLVVALALMAASVFLGYLIGGYPLTLLICAALLDVIYFFKRRTPGRVRVQLATLTTFAAVVLALVAPKPFLIKILNYFPDVLGFPDVTPPDLWEKFLILFVVSLFLIGLNWLWERGRVIEQPSVAKDLYEAYFPKRDYLELRGRFCRFMLSELDRYGRDLNWSDAEYTPLEAEVEIEQRPRLRQRIVKNLVAAIRKDRRSHAFLVIGDCG